MLTRGALAQILDPITGAPPGVYIDAGGHVGAREKDTTQQLTAMRARLRAAGRADKNPGDLTYVSLPKLLDQARVARAAGKELPQAVQYVGGLTRIRYVFVLPEEKDLVIAGPAEPFKIVHAEKDVTEFALGTRTGHPVLQLDDLVVALRTARDGKGAVFGCGIYPSPDSLKIADGIEQRMARNTRAERMQAMREQLGPQEVRIFGTRADTRFAYICVAADYELKRFAMGLETAVVPGVGNAVDATRTAANKFWFETSYDPILVSADSNAYELRGQRLATKAGEFDFDPRGATPRAKQFAADFSKNIPALAASVTLFAELQNIADEAMLANLMRHDRLAEKVGWDNAWIYDPSAFAVAQAPTPKTADTLVGFTNGSLVAGGVTMNFAPAVEARQTDEKNVLSGPLADARHVKDSGQAIVSPATKPTAATRPATPQHAQ